MLISLLPRFVRQAALLPVVTKYAIRRNVSNEQAMARVIIAQGELLGKLKKFPSGNSFASFKGIPYATPPVGELRFKAPLPPKGWKGIRDATKHGDVCPQVDMMTGEKIDGNEDCLFLNVYTPNVEGPPAPVMVWFHGGGFAYGSGDSSTYGPDYLVEKGVVLVTFNYRLEALGFLCMDSDEIPGNAGLKDQVAALKWVKQNISRFGGDPNNITLFGESAGGASVSYHMISPMSKGLFHKAICQSGCFLNEWTSCRRGAERAFKLGEVLGKKTGDKKELLKFLQSLPAEKLTKVTRLTMSDGEKIKGLPIHFGPIFENTFEGQESFLSRPVRETLESNNPDNIPVLLGYNNKEGIINLRDTLKKATELNTEFERRVPRDICDLVTQKEIREIAGKMKYFYFGDKKIGKDTEEAIIDFETDYNFSIGTIEFAKILGNISNSLCFLYRYSVDGDLNCVKQVLGCSRIKGACHGDELFYLFKTELDADKNFETERALKRTITLWTNFAKYGDPTPIVDELISVKWKPVTKNCLNFLDIGFELTPGENPDKERFDLWMEIQDMSFKKKHLKSNL